MGDFTIGEKNQTELFKIARDSIAAYLKTGALPNVTTTEKELLQPAAVFVTLTKDNCLRGCIGTTAAQLPLYQAVSQLAIAAAVEDNRFKPVTAGELKDIKIEISVLSPLTRIKNADEIEPEHHGVVVRKGLLQRLIPAAGMGTAADKEMFYGRTLLPESRSIAGCLAGQGDGAVHIHGFRVQGISLI